MKKRLANEGEVKLLHNAINEILTADMAKPPYITFDLPTLEEFSDENLISVIEITPRFKLACVLGFCKDEQNAIQRHVELYEITDDVKVVDVTDLDYSADPFSPNSLAENTAGGVTA